VVGGGSQVHQPVVGGEQAPDQAQGDHYRGGGRGGQNEEHNDGLDQDGLQGAVPARMSPVMAPGKNTRPVASVVSIYGVSAARSVARA